jgi:hypothetical protein
LLSAGVGGYVLIVFLTGTPVTFGLVVRSIWYAVRSFDDDPSRTKVVATV